MRTLLFTVLLLGVLGASAVLLHRPTLATSAPLTTRVERGSFAIELVEEGEFKASENREIRVDLEAHQEDLIVRRVVPEGTHVAPGDLLLEFDPSKLRLDIEQRVNQVEIRRKDLVNADEDLNIARLERTFSLDDAQAQIALAGEEEEKYRAIEGPKKLKEAEVAVGRAEYAVVEKKRILSETETMAAKGISSEFELRKAQQEVHDADTDRDIARLALEQLVKYDHPHELRRRQAAVAEKRLLLETRRQSCDSKITQKESAVLGIRLDLQRKEAELATLQRDLERFTLRAPVAGFVLYGNPEENPWHRPNEDLVLKEGAKVYPRRTLMTIPDLSVVKVRMQVNERDIGRLKVGMNARIEAAALPDVVFTGTVDRIAQMASPQRQWFPQDNSFEVESTVVPHDSRIKPGMKCKVTILVEEVRDVLRLPLAALREHEGRTTCRLATQPPQERPVRVGRANDEVGELLEGLAEGDAVLLAGD